MRFLRHGCDVRILIRIVGKDREGFSADLDRIAFSVLFGGRATASALVDCEKKPKFESCFGDKIILCFLETSRLLCAAASPSRREIHNVIFAGKIPKIDHFTALVDQLRIIHRIAKI